VRPALFGLYLAAIAVGCSASFVGPSKPGDYPCGNPDEVQCVAHMCCSRGNVCGGKENGSYSCPSGACCYVSDDFIGVGATHHPNTSQRPE